MADPTLAEQFDQELELLAETLEKISAMITLLLERISRAEAELERIGRAEDEADARHEETQAQMRSLWDHIGRMPGGV
jgi:uncharacterized protein Yka (UPF0111/DUF47 family)